MPRSAPPPASVVPPSPELPATTHHGDGHVMSFWRYLPPADPSWPPRADEETIGWLWHDFEDTCSGPVAWDVAASTSSRYQDGPRVLAAYGDPVDPRELAVCEQLRWLHLTVWYNLYAERLPELGPRAAELLATWPTG